MKRGLDLAELTNELEYAHDNRRDYRVGTDTMALTAPTNDNKEWRITFRVEDQGHESCLSDHAMKQVLGQTHFPYTEFSSIVTKGTAREREALARFLTVRLDEHPASKILRERVRFWDPPKIVGFLPANFTCPSSYSMLSTILGVGLQVKDLTFLCGNLDDTYLTVEMIGPKHAGIIYQYSEVGAICGSRGFFKTDEGLRIVTLGTWMNNPDPTDILTDAAKAFKKYQGLTQYIPVGVDISGLVSSYALGSPDITRKIMARFERTQHTHKDLIDSVAGYAQASQKLSYDEALQLESFAGSLIEFNGDNWSNWYDEKLALTQRIEKQNGNGAIEKSEKEKVQRKARTKNVPQKASETAAV